MVFKVLHNFSLQFDFKFIEFSSFKHEVVTATSYKTQKQDLKIKQALYVQTETFSRSSTDL